MILWKSYWSKNPFQFHWSEKFVSELESKMRGRGGFLELEPNLKMYFSSTFSNHQQIMFPKSFRHFPVFTKCHKRNRLLWDPARPRSGHWSVHKISFLLLLSGVCEESRRTGSGKFDNLRPNLINGALKSAVQGSFAGQKGPHPVQSTAQFLKDLPIQDEVKTAKTRSLKRMNVNIAPVIKQSY